MEEKIETLKKEYEETLEAFGRYKLPILVKEGGKIKIIGKRWIVMSVKAFPGYMIKENTLCEELTKEALYWFGYNYGENIANSYGEDITNSEISGENLLKLTGTIMALFAGWGIPEFIEYDLKKGRLVVKVYDDFETESARINNIEPSSNYLRGLFSGIFAKIIGAKTKATAEFKDGVTIITVEKR
jgi:predicted hydrocarbon binding protein